MVKVTIGGQSKDFQFGVPKADYGHIPPSEEYPAAIAGKPIWLPVILSGLSNLNSVTLTGMYGENFENSFKQYERDSTNDEWRQKSRLGIWTAVKDSAKEIVSVDGYDRVQNSNAFPHGNVENCNVRLDKWDFGNKAMIMLDISQEKFSFHQKIRLSICVMPYFLARHGEDAKCSLRLQFQGQKIGSGNQEILATEYVTFTRNDDLIIDDQQIDITHLVEFGALHKKGEGNSIHPKQLLTSNSLIAEVKNIPNNQLIDIAYIGTDTTENFSSLIRTVKSHIVERIGKIRVYFTDEWDRDILDAYPSLLEAAREISEEKFDLKFVEIPSKKCTNCGASDFTKHGNEWSCADCGSMGYERPQPENINGVDFIISTYVTPWVVGSETEDQYVKMLETLMSKKTSRLISVDPKADDKSIRSWCSHFDLAHIYKKRLNLRSKKIQKPKNECVEAFVWSKREGQNV